MFFYVKGKIPFFILSDRIFIALQTFLFFISYENFWIVSASSSKLSRSPEVHNSVRF